MNICIIGDSLSFGRPKYNIFPGDTWPYRLRDELNGTLTLRSRGGAGVAELLRDARQFSNYYPVNYFELAVLQVGIVDVTPRLISPRIQSLLRILKVNDRLNKKLGRSRRLVEIFGKPNASAWEFQRMLTELHSVIALFSQKTIILSILRPSGYLVKNCGDFSQKVDEYNDIISDIAGDTYVDIAGVLASQNGVLSDGYHLTSEGHQQVSQLIIQNGFE